MKRIAGGLLIVLVLSLMVGGCYQSAPTSAPTSPPSEETTTPAGGTVHQVTIKDFAFSPEVITIKVGDTVTWTEQDTVHHTVTAGGIWNSGDLGQGKTYSKTFDEAGTYSYICNYHPNMQGRVIVE